MLERVNACSGPVTPVIQNESFSEQIIWPKFVFLKQCVRPQMLIPGAARRHRIEENVKSVEHLYMYSALT